MKLCSQRQTPEWKWFFPHWSTFIYECIRDTSVSSSVCLFATVWYGVKKVKHID